MTRHPRPPERGIAIPPRIAYGRRLLPLALLAAIPLLPGCPSAPQDLVFRPDLEEPARRFRVRIASDLAFGLEPAPLHPAVLEYLLNRPELPFLEGSNDPALLEYHHAVAAALAPLVNERLAEDGIVLVYCNEHLMHFVMWTSKRARMVILQLTMWGGEHNVRQLGYDLRRVPGAFDPSAELSYRTVARRARAMLDREPR